MTGPFGPFKLYVQKNKGKKKSRNAANARDKHGDTTDGAVGQKRK